MSDISTHGVLLPHRPRGVWVMTIWNALAVGLLVLGPAFDVVLHPHADWNQATLNAAPYIIALTLLLELSVVGTWFGNRHSRNLMILLLGLVAMLMIWESIAHVLTVAELMREDHHTLNARDLIVLTSLPFTTVEDSDGPRWVLWLGINYWYFFRSGARHFYAS